MRYEDITQFTRGANYKVTIPWSYLESGLGSYLEQGLDLDPDFQRAHVWTREQQIRYVEYILRGGISGRDIYTNCAGWMRSFSGPFVLVDGKQRLQAVRLFLAGEIPAFDHFIGEYNGKPNTAQHYFNWHVNDLETRAEVLQWYIDLNAGGVLHTDEEIDRVRRLLDAELAV